MTPTIAAPAPPAPSGRPPGDRVVIPNTDWETYTKLLRVFAERPGVKLAYDRGVLEIMSPSLRHDHRDRILARLVVALTEELGLAVVSGGGTTMRRRRKKKGIEGDEIFWIANAAKMAGVGALNLKVNPPPDLAVEVDVSRSSLDRLGIYAALGVPEVWRLEADALRFYARDAAGRGYTEVAASVAFPFVAPADLLAFVERAGGVGNDNAVVGEFRAWVRQRIPTPPPPAP